MASLFNGIEYRPLYYGAYHCAACQALPVIALLITTLLNMVLRVMVLRAICLMRSGLSSSTSPHPHHPEITRRSPGDHPEITPTPSRRLCGGCDVGDGVSHESEPVLYI
jgi:hypothetical protein